MDIKRAGSRPSGKGPADYFTGTVRIDPLFQAADPARVAGASVTFEPGARTAWHTHPLGQTLIVTAGCGWAQHEGGAVEEIRPGDVVWFPPGEKHWHGATATTGMTHIAVQEALNGKTVEWLEQVSEEQYRSDGIALGTASRAARPSPWGEGARRRRARSHHPSTHGRRLPSRTGCGGSERRPATIQRRVSAGSITSSTSNRLPALSALPRS